jgi:hypothetical protein
MYDLIRRRPDPAVVEQTVADLAAATGTSPEPSEGSTGTTTWIASSHLTLLSIRNQPTMFRRLSAFAISSNADYSIQCRNPSKAVNALWGRLILDMNKVLAVHAEDFDCVGAGDHAKATTAPQGPRPVFPVVPVLMPR